MRFGDFSKNISKLLDRNVISIHTPRVGRDLNTLQRVIRPLHISIHTPRVGRDHIDCFIDTRTFIISIHTPRVGRDYSASLDSNNFSFQSTRPVWGVTAMVTSRIVSIRVISIHTPRVGRDLTAFGRRDTLMSISIHTPRVGRD